MGRRIGIGVELVIDLCWKRNWELEAELRTRSRVRRAQNGESEVGLRKWTCSRLYKKQYTLLLLNQLAFPQDNDKMPE